MEELHQRTCVIDLECTCWAWDAPFRYPHEIIEIGAVILNEDLSIARSRSFYVQPVDHPVLTDYCTQLTGITQAQIDNASSFLEVFPSFIEWLDGADVMCSWGDFDRKQLQYECARLNLKDPFTSYVNVKQMYLDKLKRTKGGLQKACRVLNIPFEGTPHCGVDDAIMTAKIFERLNQLLK